MAFKAIDGTMMKQVALLSYNDVYLFVGVFLLCCIPLLYLQKFKKKPVIVDGGH
jgi:DHA2 family multidrug resistance protein